MDSKETKQDRRLELTERFIESFLNEHGVRGLAFKINELYDQYCELADMATNGRFDGWDHKQLISFLSKNQ